MATQGNGGLTRRDLLRTIAAGSAAVAAGGVTATTAAASRAERQDSVDVTLTTGGWPYGPIPTAEEQKVPAAKAYADSLQAWLDQNPGVKVELVSFDVWNQEGVITGLAGGTAPAFIQGNVIGGWGEAGIRNAWSQGLVANVTSLLQTYEFNTKIAEYAKPMWDRAHIDNEYFAAPQSYNVGTGVHYRRDWLKEAGVPEPTPDWTWDDLRAMVKAMTTGNRRGIGLQGFGLDLRLSANGFWMLTELPAPDTNWNWRADYMSMADTWVADIEATRAMIFEDKSVLADIAFGDGDLLAAFNREEIGAHTNTVVFHTPGPGSAESVIQLEEKYKKPLDEIVGWLPMPNGANGHNQTSDPQIDLVSFSPDLDDDALDKAVSLHAYMMGPGFVEQKVALHTALKDLRIVYDWANITPVFSAEALPGLPGSPDEAWGKTFMDAVRAVRDRPLAPIDAWYIPPEETVGPTDDATTDMFTRWFYEAGQMDIRADLQSLEETVNSQNEGFSSSTSDDVFRSAAGQYYAALNAHWEANAPEFHSSTFAPWYQEKIVPAVGTGA